MVGENNREVNIPSLLIPFLYSTNNYPALRIIICCCSLSLLLLLLALVNFLVVPPFDVVDYFEGEEDEEGKCDLSNKNSLVVMETMYAAIEGFRKSHAFIICLI